jgi:hypothetical protein
VGRVIAVRRLSGRLLGGALVALAVGASIAAARTVVVKERARLRAAPSGTSDLVGWVSEGAQVEVLGESAGWLEVQAPDGHGYVWGVHTAAADAVERPPVAPPAPGATLLDEVRALREEVRALRERPEPATAENLERLRAEVERSLGSGRESAPRIQERSVPMVTPVDPPESALALTPVLLIAGAVVGWTVSRLFQRRRDRRQRNRLRL